MTVTAAPAVAALRSAGEHLARAAAAARQDMEFRSTLAVARHHVENLLAALCGAVAEPDPALLTALLRTVRIVLDDGGGTRATAAHRLPAWLSPDSRPILVTSSSLSVASGPEGIQYAGVYQVWNAEGPLDCLSHGTFHGRLEAGPQVWVWTEHAFRRRAP